MDSSTLRGIVSAVGAAVRRHVLPIAAGLITAAAQADACPERLRIAFPEGPAEPFMRGQGEDFLRPPGLLVDWVRNALREQGCLEKAEMLRLPVRRLRNMIEAGQVDMVAGVGEGGPIAALLALPPREGRRGEFDYSLGAVEYVLYARRGSGIAWDGQSLSGLSMDARVGVTASTRTEMLAKERGWSVDAAPSHESALLKVAAGRTPVLLMHSYFADDRLKHDPRLAGQIERLLPAVERRHLFVGVAPAMLQGSKDFTLRLWRALCKESAASKADGACRPPP
ncbi:substrate-binding periplasmic protein [Roseateles sp. NT4]|uniref:substrate-binding periplasmic protein n=1 Tax=Roseateles sp. NT4 TaxID=3453715 RepID=UPI003EEDCA0D